MEEEYDDELFEHYSFTAEKGLKLVRVDKFLMDRLENTTRTKIQDTITNGRVIVLSLIHI